MGGATTDLTAIGAGRNTVVQVRAVLRSEQRHASACRLFLWRVSCCSAGLLEAACSFGSCPMLQPPNSRLT